MGDLIDYTEAGFWLKLGQWVFNGLVAIYLWVSRKHAATNKRMKELTCRVEETEKKIVQVCSDLDHLPGQGQFEKLGKDIMALTKELSEVKGRLGGINRAVDLINEFLINQGAKK